MALAPDPDAEARTFQRIADATRAAEARRHQPTLAAAGRPKARGFSFWSPSEAPGCSYVEISEGFAVADRFTFVVSADELPTCHLEVSVVGGRPICTELRLELGSGRAAPAELTGTLLRSIPLGMYLTEAVAHAAFPYTRDQEGATSAPFELAGAPAWRTKDDTAPWSEMVRAMREVRRQPRQGIPVSEDDLREVATVYRAAVTARQPPTRAVMERWNVARATASRWIARARADGYLGKAQPGKAGELIDHDEGEQ